MKLTKIQDMAFKLGIRDASKMNKAELIRAIQTVEGNLPCFETEKINCAEDSCLWRSDCVKE